MTHRSLKYCTLHHSTTVNGDWRSANYINDMLFNFTLAEQQINNWNIAFCCWLEAKLGDQKWANHRPAIGLYIWASYQRRAPFAVQPMCTGGPSTPQIDGLVIWMNCVRFSAAYTHHAYYIHFRAGSTNWYEAGGVDESVYQYYMCFTHKLRWSFWTQLVEQPSNRTTNDRELFVVQNWFARYKCT